MFLLMFFDKMAKMFVFDFIQNLGGCFGTGAGRLKFTGALEQLDSRRGMLENTTYVGNHVSILKFK